MKTRRRKRKQREEKISRKGGREKGGRTLDSSERGDNLELCQSKIARDHSLQLVMKLVKYKL
ncbi:hypothetical protein Syun_018393 [Stephania yunnanensis]|uniref:Uncharacterized protein n=1 Tax=Stephania yunnanensis TaxID=152371 RepID=A0AAP0NYC2_9MAGN